MWGYARWRQDREEKLRDDLETEQWKRIEALEKADSDLRYWLRKQGIRVSRHDEPSPPEVRLSSGDSA